MKRKILIIVSFIFFLLLFDRLIITLISKYNHLLFKDNSLEKPLTDYLGGYKFNTLILGTSRTYEAIHPTLIQTDKMTPFKWGYAGFGPKYNYYFYKLFKKINGAPPELILYGMDYFIFSVRSTPLALSEININATNGLLDDFFSPTLLLLKNKNTMDILFNDIINSLSTSKSSLFEKITGIQGYTGVEKSLLTNARVHTKKIRPKANPYIYAPGEEGEYFIKLLDEIEKDQSKIILIVIPDHIGTYMTNRFQRAFRNHLKKLRREYSNLSILNYNYIRKFELEDESLFIDGGYGYGNSHMSKKGAAVFNDMLKKDLRRMGY